MAWEVPVEVLNTGENIIEIRMTEGESRKIFFLDISMP